MSDTTRAEIPDIRAKEFFDNTFDMDWMTPGEREAIYAAAELYAEGRVRFASSHPTPPLQGKERCQYEKVGETYFGLPSDVPEDQQISADYGQLVNLLAYYDSQRAPLQGQTVYIHATFDENRALDSATATGKGWLYSTQGWLKPVPYGSLSQPIRITEEQIEKWLQGTIEGRNAMLNISLPIADHFKTHPEKVPIGLIAKIWKALSHSTVQTQSKEKDLEASQGIDEGTFLASHTASSGNSDEHELKTWPEYFEKVASGEKSFEVRKNDRKFQVGDVLHLIEWQPTGEINKELTLQGFYTGRSVRCRINYILDSPSYKPPMFGLEQGHCIMSISLLNKDQKVQECDANAAPSPAPQLSTKSSLPSEGDREKQ